MDGMRGCDDAIDHRLDYHLSAIRDDVEICVGFMYLRSLFSWLSVR